MYSKVQLSNYHSPMFRDIYQNAKQAQLTLILDQDGKKKIFLGFSHKKCSAGTVRIVTKVTSAFRSMGKDNSR